MTGGGDAGRPPRRSALEGMAPPGLKPPPPQGAPPKLPRTHLVEDSLATRPKGWRRWLRWLGLPVFGAGALMLPRPAMAPDIVQTQPVAPRASDGRGEDPVLQILRQIDQKADAVSAGQSAFRTIVDRLAAKAADLAIDLLLIAAAKGAWHLARAVRTRRRDHIEPGDEGAAELESLERWIDAQDRAALDSPELPPEPTLLAMGTRMFERMRAEARAAICAEKGLPRKLAADTTKEVAEQLRKALGRGEPGTALSLAIAGLAAAVGRMGLDSFCSAQEIARP